MLPCAASSALMAMCWVPLHPPSHARQNVSWLEVLNRTLKQSKMHSSTTTENPVFLGLQTLIWVARTAPTTTCWIPLHPPSHARENECLLEVLNLTLKQSKMHLSTTIQSAAIIVITLTYHWVFLVFKRGSAPQVLLQSPRAGYRCIRRLTLVKTCLG